MMCKRISATITVCILTSLLCGCGPANTLSVQNNSADFRLKAVEASLQKAQDELKSIGLKQNQNDARVAELHKKLGELLAVLQSQGVKLPAVAPQGSALGVGFARPGATGVESGVETSQASMPAPTPAAADSGPSPDKNSPAASAAMSPQAPAGRLPAALTQGPKTIPAPIDPKGRRGYGRVGSADSTPEAAIAADRVEGPAASPSVAPSAQKASPASAAQVAAPEPAAGEPAAPAPAAKAAETKPLPPVAGNAENATPTEKNEYNKALQMAINGNTAEAKAAFDQFLVAHPQSPLTPNALYWVGEGAFAKGDYQTAINDFDKVAKGWPGHHKAADSLYKMAAAQEKAGDVAGAKATLERYLKDYPNADLAGVARQKLQSLPK
jgi:tol-pal system protein YbgF